MVSKAGRSVSVVCAEPTEALTNFEETAPIMYYNSLCHTITGAGNHDDFYQGLFPPPYAKD